MIEREVMGHTIIECSPEEARLIWKRKPELRPLLWTHDEVTAHLLSSPDTLRGVIEAKRRQPGNCLN
jgi:hypothetical protein